MRQIEKNSLSLYADTKDYKDGFIANPLYIIT